MWRKYGTIFVIAPTGAVTTVAIVRTSGTPGPRCVRGMREDA